MKKYGLIVFFCFFASGCTESENTSSNTTISSTNANSFPPLPSGSSEKVILEGSMVFWMFEGEAGCYGTISDGLSEVELWIDADSCGDKEYGENEKVTVEITFNPNNQYGPGRRYTIMKFK